MNKLEKHNQRVTEDFNTKEAVRKNQILKIKEKIKNLQKELDQLEKINQAGPQIAMRKTKKGSS